MLRSLCYPVAVRLATALCGVKTMSLPRNMLLGRHSTGLRRLHPHQILVVPVFIQYLHHPAQWPRNADERFLVDEQPVEGRTALTLISILVSDFTIIADWFFHRSVGVQVSDIRRVKKELATRV